MSFFLVFLAVVLIGVAAFLGAGIRRSGTRGGVNDASPAEPGRKSVAQGDGLDDPLPNLPPILLPTDPTPADVDRVRFSLGLRGYRMDQVDQVLDRLRDQLARKNEEIARLTSSSDDAGKAGGHRP